MMAGASMLLLAGCEAQMKARNNGAIVMLTPGMVVEMGETMEWSGGKDAAGLATGQGKETWFGVDGKVASETEVSCVAGKRHGPYVSRHFEFGNLIVETKGTYSNGVPVGEFVAIYFNPDTPTSYVKKTGKYDAYGRLHGQAEQRLLNGERTVQQWNYGILVSSVDYNRDGTVKVAPRTSSSSYSSSDDSDLLGAALAIGGAAVGSADMTMAGISTVAGDEASAMQHIGNMAGGATTGVGSATTLVGGNTAVAPKPVIQKRDNLIDEYKLTKYRHEADDHIKFYIASADRALQSYHQTGEEAYYTQHREYADTALQYHKQTSTKGTRMIR